MRARPYSALLMVMLMASAPLSGCFGEESGEPSSSDLSVNPEVVVAGVFQPIELVASESMSVYVPYLIKDPETGFVQNTTVVDIGGGDTVVLRYSPHPGRMACSCLSVSTAGATGRSDTRASLGKHGSPEGGRMGWTAREP